jgi:putative transposase
MNRPRRGASRCAPTKTVTTMTFNPKIHHRSSIRLKQYDYSWPGWYYVTMCTKDRDCTLGDVIADRVVLNEIGKISEQCWRWLGERFPQVELDEYVIMPNHLHGIVIINEPRRNGSRTTPTQIKTKPLGRLIGAFKTTSTKQINQRQGTPGDIFWQRGFYEHVIRNDADLHRIRQYIQNNPQKWALDEENPNHIP